MAFRAHRAGRELRSDRFVEAAGRTRAEKGWHCDEKEAKDGRGKCCWSGHCTFLPGVLLTC